MVVKMFVSYLTDVVCSLCLDLAMTLPPTQTTICSLQFCVCSFTLPRFEILARRPLFSAAMLFFIKSLLQAFNREAVQF